MELGALELRAEELDACGVPCDEGRRAVRGCRRAQRRRCRLRHAKDCVSRWRRRGGAGFLWAGAGGEPGVRVEVGVRVRVEEVGVRVEVGVLGAREEGVRVGVLGVCVGVRVRLGVCGGESVCGGA